MINDDRKLQDLIRLITPRKSVSVDTEADSLHAYPAKLCLIQISVPDGDYLIDPLSENLDLQPLLKVLKKKLLILHGADYDLRLLYQTFGFKPGKIFDTMIASRLLGFTEFGLGRLTEQLLDLTLDKGAQREDWARRPLSPRMEEYAKCDTRYLRELATILQTKLKSKRRLSWLRETCERLIEDCAQPVVVNSETCWRLKGHDKLSRLGLAILRELFHWREKEAISARKPPFFVLPHDLLVRISELRSNSSSKSAVQEVQQRLPRNFSPRRRREVQEAINQALRLPASELPPRRLPRPAPLPEVDQDLFEDFRKRRDAQAEKWGIDPSLIASKATLMNLARDSEEPLHRLMDWQSKALGLK